MVLLLKENKTKGFEVRPWGGFYLLHTEPQCKVKRLVIEVGAKTSLQLHQKRTEHLIVEEGKALVVLAEHELLLEKGDKFDVPVNTIHRIQNVGAEPLKILEVQMGAYLEEDDIVRLQDEYGRA